MSDCNFSLPFQDPVSVIIAKAKAAIESYNGTFNGDETSGDFGITVYGNTIKGNYAVAGQVMNLVITHKPFFVPCSTIENLLLKQINQ
ncbi:MAG: hypothetical protein ACTHK0_06540 [Ginsengibacter sp.]